MNHNPWVNQSPWNLSCRVQVGGKGGDAYLDTMVLEQLGIGGAGRDTWTPMVLSCRVAMG